MAMLKIVEMAEHVIFSNKQGVGLKEAWFSGLFPSRMGMGLCNGEVSPLW